MDCQTLHDAIWRLFYAFAPHAASAEARALLMLAWGYARRAADIWGAHDWAMRIDALIDLFNWNDRCA